MSDSVKLQRRAGIAVLLLNRPEQRNAFNLEMWKRLAELMADLSADSELRCILIRGAGDQAFSAGADMKEFMAVRANSEQAADYARVLDSANQAVRDCPHPVVAAIRGACTAGGLELALHCDLRIAAASSRFGIPINRIGHCLPYAAMLALVEVVGRPTALEILLEGRIMESAEALAKGLVTRVVADAAFEAEVNATVERIARGAPLAARGHKRFSRRALDPKPLSSEEWREPFESCDSNDYRRGLEAFVAKREPQFSGD